MGTYGTFLTQAGTWWGTEIIVGEDGGRRQQSADIDVVGLSDIDKGIVLGECKFKNEKIDKKIYETLIRRSSVLSGKFQLRKTLLFSLSGYTDWFEELEDEQLIQYTLYDLYQ